MNEDRGHGSCPGGDQTPAKAGRHLGGYTPHPGRVFDRGLFVVEKRARFDFFTYASSAGELSAYWEELEAFDSTPQDDPQTIREKYLYARVDEALREFGEGAEAV